MRTRVVTIAGFTVAESLVSIFAFIFILGSVFLLFSISYRGFVLSQTRQDIQNEVLRARQWLEQDFSLTHLGSIGILPRQFSSYGESVSRDAVCALTVSEWSDDNNFFPTGLPRWNRYVIYYATQESSGRLIRQVIDPQGMDPPLIIRPYPKLYSVQPIESLDPTEIVSSRQLASDVVEFSCRLDLREQSLWQVLKVRKRGGRATQGLKQTDQVIEATFRWDPLNTAPRL